MTHLGKSFYYLACLSVGMTLPVFGKYLASNPEPPKAQPVQAHARPDEPRLPHKPRHKLDEDKRIAIRLIERLQAKRDLLVKNNQIDDIEALAEAIAYIGETVGIRRTLPDAPERASILAELEEMEYLREPGKWAYGFTWFEGEVIADMIGAGDKSGPPGRVIIDAFTAKAVADAWKRVKEKPVD